ncbi:hypothetical protein [Methylocella silvestris]|nr:hypothetical protein [Methylocella silvestris]
MSRDARGQIARLQRNHTEEAARAALPSKVSEETSLSHDAAEATGT